MVLKVSDLESSPEAIEAMVETAAWKDVIRLMKDRIDYLRELMDNESDILEIRLMQGEIMSLKNFTISPDTLIGHLVLDKQMSNTKEEKK